MQVTILPSAAHGVINAPPSKSMSHRLLICAGLAKGESVIKNIMPSEDILATLDCLKALGAKWHYEGNTVFIKGIEDTSSSVSRELLCRESGSTMRFFIPISLLSSNETFFYGSKTLFSRPLSVYEEICKQQQLLFEKGENSLRVQGKLSAGCFNVPANISSQFISGLLFALPLLNADSSICLIPPVESLSYIRLSVQALSKFGVYVNWKEEMLTIPGTQHYIPQKLCVEGDYSNAAFFAALNCMGSDVEITWLEENSLQGDKVYASHFQLLEEGKAEIDISDCPDLAPVLFSVAAAHHGGTFTGTKRLKIKESDRGSAMSEELEKFGVVTTIKENSITVDPSGFHPPHSVLSGHNDHRIVMALSVLATKTGGVIEGAEAVKKSLPDFFDRLRLLGVEVKENAMDK